MYVRTHPLPFVLMAIKTSPKIASTSLTFIIGCGPSAATETSGSGSDESSEHSPSNPTESTSEFVTSTADDSESSSDTATATCGNGILEELEECDDGNRIEFDGCDWDCRSSGTLLMSMGPGRTCAATSTFARCWGGDFQGQLGNNDGIVTCTPSFCDEHSACCTGDDEPASAVPTLPLSNLRSIATGGDKDTGFTCAVTDDGAVRCWGVATPSLGAPSLHAACSARGMPGMCSLDSDCCLGDDENIAQLPPVELGGPAVQIVAGDAHACALLIDGSVTCWGSGSATGLLLAEDSTDAVGDEETPVSVGGVEIGGKVVQLAASYRSTCAVMESGGLRCWGRCAPDDFDIHEPNCLGYGRGNYEYVGDDETPASVGDVPLSVQIAQVATGPSHTCVVTLDNNVRCWGSSWYAALGYAGNPVTTGNAAEVGDVEVGSPVRRVSVGFAHSCALLTTDEVLCWGFNAFGSLGRGDAVEIGGIQVPAEGRAVDLGGPAVSLVSAGSSTCAVVGAGDLFCWGDRYYYNWGANGYGTHRTIGDDEAPVAFGPVPFY